MTAIYLYNIIYEIIRILTNNSKYTNFEGKFYPTSSYHITHVVKTQ